MLPSPVELANPAASGKALAGMVAPLVGDSDPARLHQPMTRGVYAVATKDRKTVIKMTVVSKEEVGFDPEAFIRSSLAADTDSELVARLRGTWLLCQLMFESHDPAVYPSVDFLLQIAVRMGVLCDGVVADPVSRRYLLPQHVIQFPRVDPRIDAREHVFVHHLSGEGGITAYTLGMQKFDLPELQIDNLNSESLPDATRFLMALSQTSLVGGFLKPGEKYGATRMPFIARQAGFDKRIWDGVDVLELLPSDLATSSECLQAWVLEL